MSLAYYEQILNIFPEKPDLLKLGIGSNVPKDWPVLLRGILSKSSTLIEFEITDSKNKATCQAATKETVRKVLSLDAGQVIFIYGAKVLEIINNKHLIIDVEKVYTLKEVNDGLAKETDATSKPGPVARKKRSTEEESTLKAEATHKKRIEQNERWRTLAERWKKQGINGD